MTLKKRLARSNIAMFVIPVLVAAVLLLIGMGIGFLLLDRVYLPQLGISLKELHQTGEQIEQMLSDSAVILCVYAGAVVTALLLTIAWTNLYLTRNLFRHISEPLNALTAGVDRIRDGDLDTPIAYSNPDEFKAACDAVDEMAARLKASLEEQQIQQQKKQELIVGMSHDLKSPLTSIRAYTEALMDGVAKDETARQRYLGTIRTKEMDMEAMVNRLFEFAKMDVSAYPVQLERVALYLAVRDITEAWDAAHMNITLEIPAELNVTADRELLGRILSNLLGNSEKYSGKERVHIVISARARENLVELSVRDDGIGVPPEQLPKLFDAFYRGDAARTAPGTGSGLGLAVVKKAVESMGGTVWAENGRSGGLNITFTIPAAKEENDV